MVISSRHQRYFSSRNRPSNQNSSSDESSSSDEERADEEQDVDEMYSLSSSKSSSSSDSEESSDDDKDGGYICKKSEQPGTPATFTYPPTIAQKCPICLYRGRFLDFHLNVGCPALASTGRIIVQDKKKAAEIVANFKELQANHSSPPSSDGEEWSDNEDNDDEIAMNKTLPPHSTDLRKKYNPPRPIHLAFPITLSTVLSSGLSYVGFDTRRQAGASDDLNIRRFIAFYGAPPKALVPLFNDIREMHPQQCPSCEDLFMTCNWLKGYDLMHVLEGRWGYCEDYIRLRISKCKAMMQALRRKKMKFVILQILNDTFSAIALLPPDIV